MTQGLIRVILLAAGFRKSRRDALAGDYVMRGYRTSFERNCRHAFLEGAASLYAAR